MVIDGPTGARIAGTVGLSGQQLSHLKIEIAEPYNIPISVTGPLASPSVSIEPANVLQSLGDALFKKLNKKK